MNQNLLLLKGILQTWRRYWRDGEGFVAEAERGRGATPA
jgi:hypothetical protein